MFLLTICIDMRKPIASPRLDGSITSTRYASVVSIAALLTAPFRNLMTRSHYQLGARPVMTPKMTSLAMPYVIMRFLRVCR